MWKNPIFQERKKNVKNPIFQERKKNVKKPYFSGEKKMSKNPSKKKNFYSQIHCKKNSKNFLQPNSL